MSGVLGQIGVFCYFFLQKNSSILDSFYLHGELEKKGRGSLSRHRAQNVERGDGDLKTDEAGELDDLDRDQGEAGEEDGSEGEKDEDGRLHVAPELVSEPGRRDGSAGV